MMKQPRRKRWLYVLATILFVAVILLSATGAALAQVSQNYDLVCWGTIANGGGSRTSGQYSILADSFGQQFAGQSESSSYIVRSGYIQESLVGGANPIVPPTNGELLYLPLIQGVADLVGVCSW
jgi:hypothetical protein